MPRSIEEAKEAEVKHQVIIKKKPTDMPKQPQTAQKASQDGPKEQLDISKFVALQATGIG